MAKSLETLYSSGRDLEFGYCTNVHAGISLDQAQDNLLRIATPIRQALCPHGNLPVGLWLAHNAAEQLRSAGAVPQFGEWLSQHGFRAYTFNGFPQNDFHQPVVKHAVYEPTWLEDSRVAYTLQLADILSQLLQGSHGSISTLPLGWPHHVWQGDQLSRAGQNLQKVAAYLERLFQSTGKEIVLAIEPEPGCVLDTAPGMVDFLQQYVFDQLGSSARRYIGVCHDICHSAVMFEPQHAALAHYLDNGIRIGKVQVSSAVEVPWQARPDCSQSDSQRFLAATLQQLQNFSEPRYLHQTTRHRSADSEPGSRPEMLDDLPMALSAWQPAAAPWRIHFHVPIFVERFGNLLATRDDITQAIRFLEEHRETTVDSVAWFTGDYEVETYAWGVLPPELRVDNLADGIAQELSYLQSVLKGCRS